MNDVLGSNCNNWFLLYEFLIIAFSKGIKIDLHVIDRSISVELLQDIVNVITSLLFS